MANNRDRRKLQDAPKGREIKDICSKNTPKADVSFKYYQQHYQCLSEWNQNELKALGKFFGKVAHMTWNEIMQDGGLRMTKHKSKSTLPNKGAYLDQIDPDIKSFELRVEDNARTHGFREQETFYVVWLDRKHEICDDKQKK